MALLVAKSAILGRGLERGFTICDAQKLCSVESTIFLSCSPNRPVFRILLFFLFCFFSLFSFGLPFQNFICFFVFLSSTPFWKIGGGSSVFLFLPFHLLMFPCFFETNFPPNIPFLTPMLLSFSFFFCCLCFHGVGFCLSVFIMALFWYVFILLLFVFVVFCSCFRTTKKTVFLQFWFFVMLVKR